jgi:hypothetical protein
MLQAVSPLVLTLSLFLVTAVTTHLVMSLGQTLIHYRVAHHPIGGKIFRNHINFHHNHYCDDHLEPIRKLLESDESDMIPCQALDSVESARCGNLSTGVPRIELGFVTRVI